MYQVAQWRSPPSPTSVYTCKILFTQRFNTLSHFTLVGRTEYLFTGIYAFEEQLVSLEEAIRRLTSFPAANLKLVRRGALQPGYFADVVVFDPALIQDHATPEQPHQYATGMVHVFVNGVQVLQDGEHTGAKPGRFVRGPGWDESFTST